MSRAPRAKSTGNRHSTSAAAPPASNKHAISQRSKSFSQGEINNDFPNERPTKRQKLEVRGPKQQTLDSFFGPNAILKPPVKIAQQQPNGPLLETVNGVQKQIGALPNGTVERDEVSPRASKKPKVEKTEKQEKRTLRSQDDGPRLKSELATYFGNYEDIMFDAPQEIDFINVDSSLYIVDDVPAKAGKSVTPSPTKSMKSVKETPGADRLSSPARSQSTQALRATEVDLSSIMKSVRGDAEDPLADDAFMIAHRRAERKEKQMRNIEREHAMHEKVQLDRLLDGLQGHDWLKVLGITGVTDGEAKKFEPKRDYFIAEVQALVDKFNEWKDEEKRQRLEREAILAAERELEDEAEEDDEVSSATSSMPASSDLNYSASKQLQQEAAMAFAKAKKEKPPPPPVPYRPPSPITSFFSSKHLRESALKKSRNSRNLLAFGLPLPEVEEQEFSLPAQYITQDVLNASARERRRRQRESASNAVSKTGRGRPP